MNLINRTILIEQARVALARQLAAGLSPGGAGMFLTPVYNKATHALVYYVSSGLIDAEFGALLPFEDATQEQKDAARDAMFAAAGGMVTPEQCADLIATSIVVDCDVEGAYATYERLGLTLQGN